MADVLLPDRSNAGYVNWAKIHNVKAMGATLIALKEAGLNSYEEPEEALAATHEEYSSARKEIKDDGLGFIPLNELLAQEKA